MRLVEGWRKAWRWYSVQALSLLALLPVVWAELPYDVKAFLPLSWQPWILAALAVAGLVGRLWPQEPLE